MEATADTKAKEEKEEKQKGLDEETDPSGSIKLVAKDKLEFTIEKKLIYISNLIRTTLQMDPTAVEIPVPGVKSEILALIVQYCQHHKGIQPPIIPKPLRHKEMKLVCSDIWDANFIDKVGDKRSHLYDLILASNYLDINSLVHLGCAKVASLIKGQPLEKIKEILTQGMSCEELSSQKENKTKE